MLDVETKRRIDTARDILVGKVPDPKSQVEQITIALIYKFMDDMDAEAEELGGERTFFKGEFERYGWTRLMAPNMGGFDVISLYSESIQKMNENPNIPQLFRDIFKNAYLPYRDPETLKSFLKIINAFSYDHSEKLGDAFEYLLSVLGSQGEAGQFRTPRHIIDFMVEVIEPKKNESILDPACGTAGFLISSYKHIRKHNSSSFKPEADREAFDEKGVSIEELTLDSPKNYRGDLLTPDDRARLSGNIRGLDISPDMVRLSLVNMYLHGFTEPHIYEYDTLTSEERWNEFYDIILANPPFMSPKGGIKPHKRFSIQSNRSEVLFVDYIAEHITPTGRAAVIVPEGIIFQSGTAYKQLRKMLVENYLFAVVSLPAGVFNPYSGVKTSILFMDKALARKTENILFVKIENDGFGLGAQRRPIDRNDLPEALKAIRDYRATVANGEVFEVKKWANVLVVEKERVAGNGEYNLTGDRYKEVEIYRHHIWPLVELEEIADISAGNSAPQDKKFFEGGKYNFFRTSDVGLVHISDNLTESKDKLNELGIKGLKLFPKHTILFPKSGASTFLNHRAMLGVDGYVSSHLATITPKEDRVLPLFLFNLLIGIDAKGLTNDQNYPSLKTSEIAKIKIPLPPLEVQKEIVAEIEGWQKIIDGARQVVENYKPQIQIDPKWEMVELGEVCDIGGTITKAVNLELPYIGADSLESDTGRLLAMQTAGNQQVAGPVYEFSGRRILYSKIRPYLNKLSIVDFTGYCSSDMYPLTVDKDKANCAYLANYMLSNAFIESIRGFYERASIPKINRQQLFSVKIPLPDLETQNQIVARIEKEQDLVNANKELIRIFEQKIKDRIAAVWGE